MNTKLLTSLLFACFPVLALADGGLSSLNFAPPIGDYSVVFLGNIFGVVDGVLHGTGSQIMGNMFGVFNAAVLALGGIVIMYTLLVATLNTAHEGEVLGSQWSSIWIPMRSTLGLALLIPKASGYCMMQIFMMWVIVQGVGAADKVWNAALGYLNRGGVIVQAQQAPISLLGGNTEVSQGAAFILAGQVCMAGIQQALESQRQSYLSAKTTGAPPCASPNASMAIICNNPIPDFLSSVNMVSIQSAPGASVPYTAPMPNFDPLNNPYAVLNGICGEIQWNQITGVNGQPIASGGLGALGTGLSTGELDTASMSRAIALQQMYMDLSTVAQVIVNNNPVLNPPNNTSSPTTPTAIPFNAYAEQQFGVPYLTTGGPCSTMSNIAQCQTWGSASGGPSNGAPLFSGTEFQGAMEDYSGIMLPTLNLIQQSNNQSSSIAARAFIQNAENSGWMMAGSYFFSLVNLNGNAASGANTLDSNTGLPNSSWDNLGTVFSANYCANTKFGQTLCPWLTGSATGGGGQGQALFKAVQGMLSGAGITGGPLNAKDLIPTSYNSALHAVVNNELSATAYGYINNAIMVQLPGQPGLSAPAFSMNINLGFTGKGMQLPTIDFGCSNVKTFIFTFCLGGVLGDVFYNLIMVNVFNYFLTYVMQLINQIVMQFMMLPLYAVANIFLVSLSNIQVPGANPIVSLANMGISYINQASEMWIAELILAITNLLIPWFGLFMSILMAMALPLVAAWLSVMVSIGFTTAYYVPILPYMIFTFGSIAWLMATIEAMVAAPLVALGVSNPEGHQAFGKAEQSILILMNVFLRPALMIIGYIAAIALSYVSIWVLNAGFANAINYLGQTTTPAAAAAAAAQTALLKLQLSGASAAAIAAAQASYNSLNAAAGSGASPINYMNWASMYALFFSVLIYTSMYLTLVQKSFNLISDLPDKVLRWIGGTPESRGAEAAEWAGEVKGQVEKGGEASAKGQAAIQSEMKGATTDKLEGGKGGGKMGASG